MKIVTFPKSFFTFSLKIEKSSIIFEGGKWMELANVEGWKSWKSLQNVDGRAKNSKYKINPDDDTIKNLDCESNVKFDTKVH